MLTLKQVQSLSWPAKIKNRMKIFNGIFLAKFSLTWSQIGVFESITVKTFVGDTTS